MYVLPTDENEIDKLINNLKIDKASGFDHIHARLIKEAKMFSSHF
jgi:hypothetical protein